MNERQQAIINQLIEKKEVAVNDLAEALGVSGVTIRQDLNYLEEQGFIGIRGKASENGLGVFKAGLHDYMVHD